MTHEEQIDYWSGRCDKAEAEITRLRAERNQLLAALKLLNNTPNLDDCDPEVWRRARAAIAAVEDCR